MGNENLTCRRCREVTIVDNRIYCNSSNLNYRNLFSTYKSRAANRCQGFNQIQITDNTELTLDRALQFILAGKSEFKIVSGGTGKEYYYRLLKKKTHSTLATIRTEYIYWLYGGNTYDTMKFLGTIFLSKTNFEFSQGLSGTAEYTDTIIKAILYVLNKLYKKKFNINVRIYHHNKCGKCGRQLNEVESIIFGIDYNCRKKLIDFYDEKLI